MIELLTAHKSLLIDVYTVGVFLSLLVRMIIISSSISINSRTRLKELKNITKHTVDNVVKKSYMSLVWPVEVAVNIKNIVLYLLKK
jgi:hypothetical protein